MSTAVVPDVPTDAIEPVDPPEVVREKAGVERTAALVAEWAEKVRSFNKQIQLMQSDIDRLQPKSLFAIRNPFTFNNTKEERLTADRIRLRARLLPLVVAAEQLARYASGLIENARLLQIDKIELQLRNAELEAELIEARHLIG